MAPERPGLPDREPRAMVWLMTVQALPQTETIGIDADNDADVVKAIERSFGVHFDDQTRQWFTVGDIYEELLASLPQEQGGTLCATSMAFYQVRAFLRQQGGGASHKIRPQTKLRVVAVVPPRRLFRRLAEELGVETPAITLSWWGGAGVVLVLGGLLGFITSAENHALWPVMLSSPLGIAMIVTDVGAYGKMTVGDVSRRVAANNFRHFALQGADARPAAVWRALCAVLAEATDVAPEMMTRDTRLLA